MISHRPCAKFHKIIDEVSQNMLNAMTERKASKVSLHDFDLIQNMDTDVLFNPND